MLLQEKKCIQKLCFANNTRKVLNTVNYMLILLLRKSCQFIIADLFTKKFFKGTVSQKKIGTLIFSY